MKTAVRIRAVSRKNEDHVLVLHVIVENDYITKGTQMGYRKKKKCIYPFVLIPPLPNDICQRMAFDERGRRTNWRSRMTTNLFNREVKKGSCFTVWNGAIEYIFEMTHITQLT